MKTEELDNAGEAKARLEFQDEREHRIYQPSKNYTYNENALETTLM